MPTLIDILFAAFFSLGLTWYETKFEVPRFRARVARDEPHARRNAYRRTIIGQWLVALAALALWVSHGRSWADLGAVPPKDWRLVFGVVLSVVVVAAFGRQFRAIARATPERLSAYRPKLEYVSYLLPRTREERAWFIALATTAGICEELLYRGYLLWLFRAWLGTPLAAVATILLFTVGHAYQGRKALPRVAGAAVAMTIAVLASGWLLPAMLLHAVVDASAGVLGYKVFATPHEGGVAAAV